MSEVKGPKKKPRIPTWVGLVLLVLGLAAGGVVGLILERLFAP